MKLVFGEQAENLHDFSNGIYQKLDFDSELKSKVIWLFPDMIKSFGIIENGEGNIVIDPSYYYITSGEAIRKTEVLISDIKEKLEEFIDNEKLSSELTDMLLNISEFYDLLLRVKNESDFLEITKCDDGIYNGNICVQKNKKVKKTSSE
jgi:hypothetical protein